jgi:CRP-like cAMP-binding protein
MENNPIDTFFNSFNFSEIEKLKMLELNLFKTITKGTILIKEGDFPKHNFIVIKGSLREYRIKDGMEKTIEFYVEEDAIFSDSTFNGKPSESYLVSETDCILLRSSEKEEHIFRTNFPRINSFCNSFIKKEVIKRQSKYSNYSISNPEERYLNILQNKPYMLQRFSQYHIASYIGVKPESLSRIKKRISKIS